MASITRERNSRRIIQFVGPDGKRRSIRLGKVPQRQAEAVKTKVEQLVVAAISGHADDDETARWVSRLDSVMADKLTRVGLIRKQASVTLGKFVEDYIQSRHDSKPRTIILYRQTQRSLIKFSWYGQTSARHHSG